MENEAKLLYGYIPTTTFSRIFRLLYRRVAYQSPSINLLEIVLLKIFLEKGYMKFGKMYLVSWLG